MVPCLLPCLPVGCGGALLMEQQGLDEQSPGWEAASLLNAFQFASNSQQPASAGLALIAAFASNRNPITNSLSDSSRY